MVVHSLSYPYIPLRIVDLFTTHSYLTGYNSLSSLLFLPALYGFNQRASIFSYAITCSFLYLHRSFHDGSSLCYVTSIIVHFTMVRVLVNLLPTTCDPFFGSSLKGLYFLPALSFHMAGLFTATTRDTLPGTWCYAWLLLPSHKEDGYDSQLDGVFMLLVA